MTTIACACGALTLAVFARRDSEGNVRSCWVAVADDGIARAGCVPNEDTGGVVERRNARVAAALAPPPVERPTYPAGAIVRCACARLTRVLTSNLNEINDPPAVDDAPDPTVKVGPTACWLAIADDGGPAEGCAPQDRTWEVLERRGRGRRPTSTIELSGVAVSAPAPSIEERERFAALRASAAPPGEPVTPEEPSPMLSLFG
jgi:hypothetical protein